MNTLVICLFLSLSLSSAERLEELYRNDKLDDADLLIRSEFPAGAEQSMAFARLAVRRNDLQEAARFYREVLSSHNASPTQKKTALFALLTFSEMDGKYDEILRICTEADALFSKDAPGKRRFVFARARALENRNSFDMAGKVYSSLLEKVAEDSPWEQTKALYLAVPEKGRLPMSSELNAKYGAARMLEKTNHNDLAESVLFSIYNSETLPPHERGESAVAITEFLARGGNFGKWESQKKIDEFLRNPIVPVESKARIINIQAERQFHLNRNFKNARNFWTRAAYLPELPKSEQAKILLKIIAAAEEEKLPGEAHEFRTKIFQDGLQDKNLRFKMLEPMVLFLLDQEKRGEAEKFLNIASRFRDLSDANRAVIAGLRANMNKSKKIH